jgi:hypothetical protein
VIDRLRSGGAGSAGVFAYQRRFCTLCSIKQENRGTIMAVLTAERTGTPAAEAPARDHGGTKPGKHQQLWYTVLALGIAAASFAGAWRLHGNASSTYRIDSHWGAFTGLFILALAIERALEPFSRKLGPDTTRRKDTQLRALADAQPDDVAGIAVECQLAVDMCRRLTAVVTWGVATGLAFLLCAQLNITLMQAVRATGSGAPPFWADLVVTGLVVGAGTKPLHDLISTIERGKQSPSAAHGKDRSRG